MYTSMTELDLILLLEHDGPGNREIFRTLGVCNLKQFYWMKKHILT